MNTMIVRETGIYFIKEQIYPKGGLPTLANTIGPSTKQIYRMVLQLKIEQDVFYDNKKVNHNDLSTWQQLRVLFDNDIISQRDKKNGKVIVGLEYAGFDTYVTPFAGFEDTLPKALTNDYLYNKDLLPAPFIYGKDPIPSVRLYNNPHVQFFMDQGGRGIPTALGKFDKNNRNLGIIKNETEFTQIVNMIKAGYEKK